MRLINGDCLEELKLIPNGSIDLVICDPPYGQTKAEHDVVIPMGDFIRLNIRGKEKLLEQEDYLLHSYSKNIPYKEAITQFNNLKEDGLWTLYNKVVKPNGCIILFGQGKFSGYLMNSAPKLHRYNLIWEKLGQASGFLNANKQPLRSHEDILVFYSKQPVYNPQKVKGKPNHSRGSSLKPLTNNNYGDLNFADNKDSLGDMKHPRSVLKFAKPHPPIFATQKSVHLIEWLIKSYSNEGDVVLDNCMGSGTTGLACLNTNRDFIGIEKNEDNFKLAKSRIMKEFLGEEE